MRHRGLPALLCALLVLLLACTSDPPATDRATESGPKLHADGVVHKTGGAMPPFNPHDKRPNIVMITTDDQKLGDLRWMPHTRRLIGSQAVQFPKAISPHPLCCPARAELLTGQYGQNNGVTHNGGPTGGYQALENHTNTIGWWMRRARYQTALVGKFLNGYSPELGNPKGWTHWNPTTRGTYTYRRTRFYNDGRQAWHRKHVDDVVTDYTTDYIREFSKRGAPFFIWSSMLAPHKSTWQGKFGWARAAPRHRGMFPGARNPAERSPSFLKRTEDYPASHRRKPITRAVAQKDFITRIRSLQAVDEGVKRIVDTLRETGELDNTYLVFVSDNGYLLGEHGLSGKNFLVEEALEVPLLVRTPQARVSQSSDLPVTLVDLVPTFLDLADARPSRVLDGTSFAPTLHNRPQKWRDTQLIQTGTDQMDSAQRGWSSRGVRTARWTYGRNLFTGEEYLFDRRTDPHEMHNLAEEPEHTDVLAELRRRTEILQDCSGAECRQSFGPP